MGRRRTSASASSLSEPPVDNTTTKSNDLQKHHRPRKYLVNGALNLLTVLALQKGNLIEITPVLRIEHVTNSRATTGRCPSFPKLVLQGGIGADYDARADKDN